MMRKSVLTSLVIFFLMGVLSAGSFAFAGSADLKARFKARLPIILKLKAQGIVGENHKGYLEFVGGKKVHADVVAAENSDRRKVYTAIAKQQGTTAETVGLRRALQIAQKAKPGEFLKDAKGNWYRK